MFASDINVESKLFALSMPTHGEFSFSYDKTTPLKLSFEKLSEKFW
ncbi:hypothetical protein HMPREF9136_0905 [Prevotella dentalis DSM 3688]|uniref:Uncharacterized protein n=1 Tax=Prevotella dentalis (strain ATCC 49559 / DSM 3688 / JCM 13448 / NCTC 12043 / ES 2772) TaxID=908937 RepID=F9D227_PREDD|nr:hypothetical protein HMPREF9136_0905 [Prevotella dentalis DSM 3688]